MSSAATRIEEELAAAEMADALLEEWLTDLSCWRYIPHATEQIAAAGDVEIDIGIPVVHEHYDLKACKIDGCNALIIRQKFGGIPFAFIQRWPGQKGA
tara:strand:- start:562 stop:855 length:294 start_codon:yes stop_codon:yes gene_type:complete